MSEPEETLAALRAARLVAVVRCEDAATAIRTAEALIEGGIRAIELTFTTPGVEGAIAHLAQARGGALIGAGTITTAGQARLAAGAGASFIVSPAAPPALVRAMAATGVMTIAGCLTPTEMLAADHAGAHAIKLFPASAVGPAYLAALRGPFPDLEFIPTGGVRPADVAAWIDAGALAVGLGGKLARPVRNDRDHRAVVAAARAAVQG